MCCFSVIKEGWIEMFYNKTEIGPSVIFAWTLFETTVR